MIVAGFLIASAVVRLGSEAGQVLARQSEADQQPDTVRSGQACEPPQDIEPVLAALQEREDRLKRQESALRDRMRSLQIADEQIEKRMSELVAAEDSLRATLALADTAAEDDIARLTAVYESMKPKDAAALFEEMDPEFAAGFVGRMRPEAAAGVMAGLSPEAAYTVSVILAGRNAEVPRQ